MLLDIFKKNYVARRFGEETSVQGYYGAPHTDFLVRLDVQPLTADEVQALPEGERSIRRIKTLGGTRLTPADEDSGVRGDWLHYEGRWYECKSCQGWDHTLLAHYEAEFTQIPAGPQTTPPEIEVVE